MIDMITDIFDDFTFIGKLTIAPVMAVICVVFALVALPLVLVIQLGIEIGKALIEKYPVLGMEVDILGVFVKEEAKWKFS